MTSKTISMYRGDARTFNVVFKESGAGTPIDITGFSVWFTVKDAIGDSDPGVIQKIVTNHDDPTNGSTSFQVSHTDTSGLSEKAYLYDIQYNDANGSPVTVVRDYFVITNDVTQSIS